MALPTASPERQLSHQRSIDVRVYSRGTGLWEVDATVRDVRAKDAHTATGVLPAGQPIHDMLLRLVVDEQFNVIEAGARTAAQPYPGACENHGDTYGQLVGLNLMRGFRRAVRERVGGIKGCTHITELSQVLPTAVMQAFAGQVVDVRGRDAGSAQPMQIDGCHALRADGAVVAKYYPRWSREPGHAAGATPAPVGQPEPKPFPKPESPP